MVNKFCSDFYVSWTIPQLRSHFIRLTTHETTTNHQSYNLNVISDERLTSPVQIPSHPILLVCTVTFMLGILYIRTTMILKLTTPKTPYPIEFATILPQLLRLFHVILDAIFLCINLIT